MDIYQFIKYDDYTSTNHLKKHQNKNVILCFDFEDSINNFIDTSIITNKKQFFRNAFVRLYKNELKELKINKIAIRVNNKHEELQDDLHSLKGLTIYSILLPKIESLSQIYLLINLLKENNINYSEIIPIIESPIGMKIINKICEMPEIKKIGFGHNDYNLSINVFPFFHQQNSEYWKWVERIRLIIKNKDIKFINSAFLDIGNDKVLKSIVLHLKEMFNENFGQFTLSSKQSDICHSITSTKDISCIKKIITTRLHLFYDFDLAKEYIKSYKTENIDKGFTVSTKYKRILSPQEYLSAKTILKKSQNSKTNFYFVGGCFPVQHNINFEDLFHQKLKNKVEKNNKKKINITIIRYERFSNCFEKIKKVNKKNDVDFIVFHVRPEPFLRLVKIYYKYFNKKNKLKHSINIPLLNFINPEKFDLLEIRKVFQSKYIKKESRLYKFLIDTNYVIGKIFGNQRYALKKYVELINKISIYCNENGIKLIILGPPLRTNTSYEKVLSKQLERFVIKNINEKSIFIKALFDNEKNKDFFHSNGIHANEKYHNEISNLIYDKMNIL